MQSVLGLAVIVSTAILLSVTGVVVPAASDGWPPPAAVSTGSAMAAELTGEGHSPTGEGHSPAVDVDGDKTSLSRRRRRRQKKHHHVQQHNSKVCLYYMHCMMFSVKMHNDYEIYSVF